LFKKISHQNSFGDRNIKGCPSLEIGKHKQQQQDQKK